jgi:hypothetical protein
MNLKSLFNCPKKGYWLRLWERELAPLICQRNGDSGNDVCQELRQFAADGLDGVFSTGDNCPMDHGVQAFCRLVAELDGLTQKAAVKDGEKPVVDGGGERGIGHSGDIRNLISS